jgi:hypothetical protein
MTELVRLWQKVAGVQLLQQRRRLQLGLVAPTASSSSLRAGQLAAFVLQPARP